MKSRKRHNTQIFPSDAITRNLSIKMLFSDVRVLNSLSHEKGISTTEYIRNLIYKDFITNGEVPNHR